MKNLETTESTQDLYKFIFISRQRHLFRIKIGELL